MRLTWTGLLLAALGSSVGCESRSGSRPNEILVLLVGGPSTGTYTTNSPAVECTRGTAGIDRWRSHFIDGAAANRLAGLQLVVPDAGGRAATTHAFYFGLRLGHFPSDARYEIETRHNAIRSSGAGTVRVEERGGVRTFTLDGSVGDSIHIAATIRCRWITRGSVPGA